jgi:hypothetical protein
VDLKGTEGEGLTVELVKPEGCLADAAAKSRKQKDSMPGES